MTHKISENITSYKNLNTDLNDIVWIYPHKSFILKTRYLKIAFILAAALLIYATTFFIYSSPRTLEESYTILFPVALIIIMAINTIFIFDFSKLIIGVSNRKLYVKSLGGKKTSARLEDIVFTDHRILIDNKVITIKDSVNKNIFDKYQIDHYLRPRLKKGTYVDETTFFLKQLINKDIQASLIAMALVGLVGYHIYTTVIC